MTSKIFSISYLHGTSLGAIGPEQLAAKQFKPKGNPMFSHLWATDVPDLAIKYAERSAKRTGTPGVLVEVTTEQPLKYVDYGKHSHRAFNTAKAPVYIKRVTPLDKPLSMFATQVRYKMPSKMFSGLLLASSIGYALTKRSKD